VLVVVILLQARDGHGQSRELHYDARVDLSVTVAATAGWFGAELFASDLARQRCLWCDRNADGSDALNGLDAGLRNHLKWSHAGAANTISYVTAYGLAPLGAFSLTALFARQQHRLDNFPVDALLIAEATALTAAATQIVKFSIRRERPFVHVLAPESKSKTGRPDDNNTSFFSLHTSVAFSLAVSSATVASLRGYRHVGWLWGVGLAVAAATGYLRIAADKHYFTDVAAGAIVGSSVGFAVPYFCHRPFATSPADDAIRVLALPLPDGARLAAFYRW